jgi:malate synthase
VEHGQGIYFYLPKMEAAEEAAFWREFFDASREQVSFLNSATIRAIALIESLPAAYQMEEILQALGPYAAGLNAARWDFQASILEFVMNDPGSVWPDPFGVDIKKTEFLGNIFRRLVAICLKRGPSPLAGWRSPYPARTMRSIERQERRSERTKSGKLDRVFCADGSPTFFT